MIQPIKRRQAFGDTEYLNYCDPDDVERLEKLAKELLEACKTALGVYQLLETLGVSSRLPGYATCLADLNAAIAKAEGR